MKIKVFLTVCVCLLFQFSSFGQCDWGQNDSIRYSKDWSKVKAHFFPGDLADYPLVFEELNLLQHDSLSSLLMLNYQAKTDSIDSTVCDYLNGNSCFSNDDYTIHKRFKKYYSGSYKVINIDSVKSLSKSEYPYVLMFYSEITYVYTEKKSGLVFPSVIRHGYYIWDRRSGRRYPVYSCLGRKEDKEFFSRLNK